MQKKDKDVNLFSNRVRFAFQGALLAVAVAAADTSTILPLIVKYFGGGEVLVGALSSLMRGGAVIMQLYTAFKAQELQNVMKQMRRVFALRFASWFFIGLSVLLFDNHNGYLILILISIFLFLFSFSAGYGVIYYQELTAKAFDKEYRGKSIAIRQFLSGFAGILSGGISAFFLDKFEKPDSFAYLFMFSGIIMAAGFGIFWKFKEPKKQKTKRKERSFSNFLSNAFKLFKSDNELRKQILTRFLSYASMMAMPFIILHVQSSFNLQAKDIGFFISLQMAGAMTGNLLWGKLSGMNRNKCIAVLSYILVISAYLLSLFASKIEAFYLIYFMIGASIDGFRLSFTNLLLIIAPEEKRPVYVAVNNNLSSLGLFLPILGGILVKTFNFEYLIIFTIFLLVTGLAGAFRLKKQ